MKEQRKNNLDTKDTITPPLKEYYPKIVVEKGEACFLNKETGKMEKVEVYFLNKETGKMEKRKDYVLGTSRDQRDPVTIGRESQETRGRKDILLSETCAPPRVSRDHCEIFFDGNESAYFLVDYSLNGTLVNGERVGGNRNRVRETRRLEHEDLIEIPAVGERERIKLTFLTRERPGLKKWTEGDVAEKPPAPPIPPSEEKKFCMSCGAEMVKEALYCPKCGKKQ